MCVTITLLYYFSFLETRLVSARGCLRLGKCIRAFLVGPIGCRFEPFSDKKTNDWDVKKGGGADTAQSPEVLEDGVWWGGMGRVENGGNKPLQRDEQRVRKDQAKKQQKKHHALKKYRSGGGKTRQKIKMNKNTYRVLHMDIVSFFID